MAFDEKHLHEKHRERMRQKYTVAKETLSDHEILEILLYHVIPRKNTNPLAHRLCHRFGSLRGVLEADMRDLMEVDEVGESTAFFLKQLLYLWKRCENSEASDIPLNSITKIGNYLTTLFSNEKHETVYLLMLDQNAKLLAHRKLFDGSITACESNARKIAEIALSFRAHRIILAHNHPDANAEPSDSDVSVTRYLRRVLAGIDLDLEEHFIVSGHTYCPIVRYLQNEIQSKPKE
ncbi:MAG: hypothetical protein IKM34_08745 [Clostridia bacterium]|nr:hypothetical protein [Clostridia bacterium]